MREAGEAEWRDCDWTAASDEESVAVTVAAVAVAVTDGRLHAVDDAEGSEEDGEQEKKTELEGCAEPAGRENGRDAKEWGEVAY